MTNTALWDVDVTAAPVAVDIRSAGADGNVMELVVGPRIYKIPSLANRSPGAPAALTLWSDMNSLSFDINKDGVPDKYFVKLMNDPVEYGVDSHSSTSIADVDKDGTILAGELCTYAKGQVVKIAREQFGNEQEPVCIPAAGQGSPVRLQPLAKIK